jgi:hypothetical protein
MDKTKTKTRKKALTLGLGLLVMLPLSVGTQQAGDEMSGMKRAGLTNKL